jgi:putative transposase
MARLPRLALPGYAHWVIQRGHSAGQAQAVFVDDDDRRAYLLALREAAAAEKAQVHAYALLADEAQLIVTPQDASSLPRLLQALGRRYVSAYNRRHGRSGTLWDGRFRCAVLEPGATLLDALRCIDGASAEPGHTSAAQRCGRSNPSLAYGSLIELPEVWALGNTPFEREAAYVALLRSGVGANRADYLRQAALGGWAAGSAAFAAQVAQAAARPSRPRMRGRPRRVGPALNDATKRD